MKPHVALRDRPPPANSLFGSGRLVDRIEPQAHAELESLGFALGTHLDGDHDFALLARCNASDIEVRVLEQLLVVGNLRQQDLVLRVRGRSLGV